MLLHIFRLEAKATPEAAGVKNIGPQEPRAQRDGSEDLNGKESAVAERMPFSPQTVLLRADVSPALESTSVGRRREVVLGRNGVHELGAVLRDFAPIAETPGTGIPFNN